MPTRAATAGSFRRRGRATRSIAPLDPGEVSIPPLPAGRPWTAAAGAWWEVVHRSAISAEWTDDDLLVVGRALSLVDDLAAIEGDPDLSLEKKARLKINISAEMRLMESSLGLSPAGRSRLRVEVVRAEDAEAHRVRSHAQGDDAAVVGDDELAERRAELRRSIEG